jgi:transcriptional regulator with XRE-family HTH domain
VIENRVLIGHRLKILRQQRKLSLRAVAELAGISAGHLSRVERGERELDSLSALEALAGVLGTTPALISRGGSFISAHPSSAPTPVIGAGAVTTWPKLSTWPSWPERAPNDCGSGSGRRTCEFTG